MDFKEQRISSLIQLNPLGKLSAHALGLRGEKQQKKERRAASSIGHFSSQTGRPVSMLG